MAKPRYSFVLRIPDRNPDKVPMKRMGEYIAEFAQLLGEENTPLFKGIRKASTGYAAAVRPELVHRCHARIVEAKSDPSSKPGRHLHNIEEMLGNDAIEEAEILDADDNVIHVIFGIKPEEDTSTDRLYQEGTVDGWVTGLVGADDTMHLHVRDHFDRDLRLIVRDEALARDILVHFRKGTVRLVVRGTWIRNDNGWSPDAHKCTVQSFELLEDTSLGEVLAAAIRVPGNGWAESKDPQGDWANIRGIH